MASILGYAFWSIASTNYTTQRWYELPLCFYDTGDTTIESPETIHVAISGRRPDLANLDTSSMAIHIDSHTLTLGNQCITLRDEHLMLPPSLTLTHWSPSNLAVMVKKNDTDERVA